MASKKKRNPSRTPSGPRPAAKRSRQPSSGPKPGGGAKGAKPAAAAKAAKPARERTGPTRSERLAAAEAARRRKATRTRALIAGGLIAVLALLTITIVNSRRSNQRVVNDLEASGACNYDSRNDADAGSRNDADAGPPRNHVSGNISYKVDPPSGGNHNPSPSPPGIFSGDNVPSDPQIVHSLEHGYVAIWHRPDLDAAAMESLRGLANEHSRDVLLVPRASLGETPVAATAWHRRLICERPDVEALERFITSYRNKGPEDVPH